MGSLEAEKNNQIGFLAPWGGLFGCLSKAAIVRVWMTASKLGFGSLCLCLLEKMKKKIMLHLPDVSSTSEKYCRWSNSARQFWAQADSDTHRPIFLSLAEMPVMSPRKLLDDIRNKIYRVKVSLKIWFNLENNCTAVRALLQSCQLQRSHSQDDVIINSICK